MGRRLLATVLTVVAVAVLAGCSGDALRPGADRNDVIDGLQDANRDIVNIGLPLTDGRPRPVGGLRLCVATPLTIIRVKFSQAAIEVLDARLYERSKAPGKDLPTMPDFALAPGGRPAVGATIDRRCRDEDNDEVVELDVLVRRANKFAAGASGTLLIEYVTEGQHHWGSLEYPLVIGYPTDGPVG